MACAPLDPANPVAERLATYLDCHAEALGREGFAHLSASWIGQAILGGALTIYVALIGYRLILGQLFGVREALMATLRAGVVLAFATSWPAYSTVVYRVVTEGPVELAGQLLPPELSPVLLPDAARRLDFDLAILQGAATLPAGAQPGSSGLQAGSAGSLQSSSPATPFLDFPGAVMLVSIVGAVAALRLAAGLLLGLGPFFILLGLFDATLGAFEGWGRGLMAVFLGSAGASVVVALELNFIEGDLIAAMSGGAGVNGTSGLLATALVFATIMLATFVFAGAVGRAFRLPRRYFMGAVAGGPTELSRSAAARPGHAAGDNLETPGRAQAVADAVLRLGRREVAANEAGGWRHSEVRPGALGASRNLLKPAGQATRRRMASSSLAGAKRRDGL